MFLQDGHFCLSQFHLDFLASCLLLSFILPPEDKEIETDKDVRLTQEIILPAFHCLHCPSVAYFSLSFVLPSCLSAFVAPPDALSGVSLL
jgi:hypothetical protein